MTFRAGRPKAVRARFLALIAVLALVLAACGNGDSDDAASVEDFYDGNTIRFIVASGTGGGFDVHARLVAEYLPNYLPGSPQVVVENMTGGGHIVAANYLANVADQDGSVLGTFLPTLLNRQLLEDEAVEYDMGEFIWLGRPSPTTNSCITRTDSGVTSIEDVIPPNTGSIRIGHSGAGIPAHDYGYFFREVLDANIELVGGYDGNAEIRLALEQGEVDTYCIVYEQSIQVHEEWRETGAVDFNYIVQFGQEPLADLPDVPVGRDLVPNEEDRQILDILSAAERFFFPIMTTPGVPDDRVAALRDALEAVYADPDFQADFEDAVAPMDPIRGEEIEAIVNETLSLPDDVLQRFRDLMSFDD